MDSKRWLLITFLVNLAGIGQAAPLTLSFSEAFQLAQDKSPEVHSLKAQIESAESKVRQALAPDTPNFLMLANDTTGFFRFSSSASSIFIFTQPLAFPGKAFVNRSMFEEQAESLRKKLRSKLLDIENTVQSGYLQLALIQATVQNGKSQQDWLTEAVAIASKRNKKGTANELDYVSAQLALQNAQNSQAELALQEAAIRSQLNSLLGLSEGAVYATEPLVAPRSLGLRLSLEQAKQKLLNRNPDVLAAKHTAISAEKNHTLAWMSLLPDFQLSLGYNRYFIPEAAGNPDLMNSYVAMVQFTIPLWGIFNEKETIVSAARDEVAADMDVQAAIRENELDLENQYTLLNNLLPRFSIYEKKLIPLAKKTSEVGMVNFRKGNVDFPTFSDAASAYGDTQIEYLNAIVRFQTALGSVRKLIDEQDLLL